MGSSALQIQGKQAAQDLFFVIEDRVFPAIGIADGLIQLLMQRVKAGGEVGGGGFGFHAVVTAEYLQGVVEVGEGAIFEFTPLGPPKALGETFFTTEAQRAQRFFHHKGAERFSRAEQLCFEY